MEIKWEDLPTFVAGELKLLGFIEVDEEDLIIVLLLLLLDGNPVLEVETSVYTGIPSVEDGVYCLTTGGPFATICCFSLRPTLDDDGGEAAAVEPVTYEGSPCDVRGVNRLPEEDEGAVEDLALV